MLGAPESLTATLGSLASASISPQVGIGRVVLHVGPAAAAPDVVDVHLQARMPLGDLPECRDVRPAGEETDAQVLLLARFPEPVERAVGPPRLLVRLVEACSGSRACPATLAPVLDDLLAVRRSGDRNARGCRTSPGAASPPSTASSLTASPSELGGWITAASTPGRFHLGQRIVDPVGRDLAMVRAHLSVLPDVDLGIDYQHASPGDQTLLRQVRAVSSLPASRLR